MFSLHLPCWRLVTPAIDNVQCGVPGRSCHPLHTTNGIIPSLLRHLCIHSVIPIIGAIPSRAAAAAGVHVLSCEWPKSGHQPTTTARTRDGSCIYISSGIIITRTATSAKGHSLSLYLCENFECTQIGRINGRAFHASIQMSIKYFRHKLSIIDFQIYKTNKAVTVINPPTQRHKRDHKHTH